MNMGFSGYGAATRLWSWLALALAVSYYQLPAFGEAMWPAPDIISDFYQDWASARNLFNGLPIYSEHRDTVPIYVGEVHPGCFSSQVNAPTDIDPIIDAVRWAELSIGPAGLGSSFARPTGPECMARYPRSWNSRLLLGKRRHSDTSHALRSPHPAIIRGTVEPGHTGALNRRLGGRPVRAASLGGGTRGYGDSRETVPRLSLLLFCAEVSVEGPDRGYRHGRCPDCAVRCGSGPRGLSRLHPGRDATA